MARKSTRDKGSGGLHKRKKDGMWVATIELPPGPDGKRRRKQLVRKDRGDAQRALRDLQAQLHEAGDVETRNIRLRDWMETYMTHIAPGDLSPKALYDRESVVRLFILPLLGKKYLDRITTDDVRRLHQLILTTPRKPSDRDKAPDDLPQGAPMLSTSYARNAHNALSAALNAAKVERKLTVNVCDLVRRPATGKAVDNALTQEQFIRLMEHLATDVNKALWATYLFTGARRGEVAGLETDRVHNVIDFSWQLKQITNIEAVSASDDYEYRHVVGKRYLVRPKTRASRRVLPLPQLLGDLLRDHIGGREGFVFVNRDGDPYDPSTIGRMWKRLMKDAGMPQHVTLHGARHTFIDMLYNAEQPVREDTVMQLVGHSSRAMSRSYRTNVELSHAAEALKGLESLIPPSGEIVRGTSA